MDTTIAWPKKQREVVRWVLDSRKWNDFEFRPDDIVVGTWSKSGTTWTQQIVSQLLCGGLPDQSRESPWIDASLFPGAVERAQAQTTRRYLKTHLSLDSIVYSPLAKYIYIGRDGRDVFWSWHNHHVGFKPEVLDHIDSINPHEAPYDRPNPDVRLAFLEWLDRDGYPNEPFFSHVQGWFDARRLPNLLMVHFANLKADMPGEIARIAKFLDIEVAPEAWPAILEHCSFDFMRQKAIAESDGTVFKGGGATFFNKGTNGRWRDVLTPEDVARYEAEVARNLTPECAEWLATGRLPD